VSSRRISRTLMKHCSRMDGVGNIYGITTGQQSELQWKNLQNKASGSHKYSWPTLCVLQFRHVATGSSHVTNSECEIKQRRRDRPTVYTVVVIVFTVYSYAVLFATCYKCRYCLVGRPCRFLLSGMLPFWYVFMANKMMTMMMMTMNLDEVV